MIHLLRRLSTLLLFFFATHLCAEQLQNIEQKISDSVITTKITAKYTQSKQLNPLKIHVSTTDATVYLSGFVKDKKAFVAALRIAKATHGVKAVDAEELVIKKVNTAFTDAYITAKVEAAILKAKVLADESIPLVGINATTSNGVVTLSGTVKTPKSAAAILKYVGRVKGVKKIIAHLEIAPVTAS